MGWLGRKGHCRSQKEPLTDGALGGQRPALQVQGAPAPWPTVSGQSETTGALRAGCF